MLRKEVMEGIEQHIQNLTDFDHIRLLEADEGHIQLEIEFMAGFYIPFAIWLPA